MSEGQGDAGRPLLEEAWLRCSSGSEKERARNLKKCVAAVNDASVELSQKDVEQMAIIAFTSLNRYTQRQGRTQVEVLIKTLLLNVGTAEAFVAAFMQLLKQELGSSRGGISPLLHMPRSSHYVLLRWTALVLENSLENVKKVGAFPDMAIGTLARLLCGASLPLQVEGDGKGTAPLPSSRPRLTRAVTRRMRTLLARCPEVGEACASFLCKQTFSSNDGNLRMFAGCISGQSNGNEEFRKKLLSAYGEMIVLTKSRLCRAELDAYTPFVESLTEAEQELIGPQIAKALRRDTTHTVMVCVHYVMHSQKPRETDLLEMCTSALGSLTAENLLLRSDCRDLVRALLSSPSDKVKDKALEKVIAAVSDRRASAKAKLEAMQLASSLSELAASFPNIDKHIVGLLKVVRSAASDAERLEVLMALAHWTSTLPSPPKEVVSNYATGIKNQQQKSVFLTSLAVASKSGQPEFEQLAGELTAIAKKSSSLQSKRYDQLAALSTLVNLGKEGDLLSLLGEDSFAYTFDFTVTLGDRQTAVLAAFATAALGRDGVQSSLLYRLIARLLALPGKGRTAVVAKVKELTTVNEGTGSSDLIRALLWVMEQLASELRAVAPKKQVAISNALGNSIRAIFHGTVDEDSSARFLQLVSQPIVSRSPAVALGLFHTGTGPNFKDFSADQLAEASAFIMRGLFSEGRIEQRAGQLALSLLSSTAPSGVRGIAELLLARVQEAKLMELSEEDIELYRTPEGELYDKSVAGTTYHGRSKPKKSEDDEDTSSSRKQSRGGKAARGGKGGRGGKVSAGPTKEELLQKAIDAKLEEEALVRGVLTTRITSATQAISGLRALAKAPAVLAQIVPLAFEAIFELIVHPVVHDIAFELLHDMVQSSGFASAGFATMVATLENRLYGSDKASFTHMEISDMLVTVFERLYSLSQANKLSVAGVYAGGPVVDYAVRTPTSFKMQDQGIRLIDAHANPANPAPRARFLLTLLSTIETAPRLSDRCREVITHLGEGLCTSQDTQVLFGSSGIKSTNSTVRGAAVECLAAGATYLKQLASEGDSATTSYLWLAQSDPEEAIARTAAAVWSSVGASVPKNVDVLLGELYEADPSSHLAKQCAAALAAAAAHYQECEPDHDAGLELIQTLEDQYERFLPPAPVITPRGYEFGEDERFNSRQCIAIALGECAPLLKSLDNIGGVFTFLATKGPLMDGAEDVRQAMIDAGGAVVAAHGKEHAAGILDLLEKSLEESDSAMTGALLREASVVFMGGLARYFSTGDPQVLVVLDRLLETLSTPSERVQSAISTCLSPLMKMAKSEDARVLDLLFDRIVSSDSSETHVRNGAAHGIAGVVKGLGNVSFKKHSILDRLKAMLENKRSFPSREGALMTVEYLAQRLQRLFEPYTVQLIDPLLKCYGDSAPAIRERTDHTAKAIMSTLRPSGVSFILPGVIAGLDAVAWRPKKAAVELLGAMAFCAPRQLGMCLPQIVPPLIEVLSDSHEEVQKSGQRALGHIASVIRNPEVQIHIPALLKALNNPEKYSQTALASLINTNFVHVIDAPSLALIMPLLDRSLRSTDMTVKRQAARIAGHMTTLADHKALMPYLDVLMPNIKATLVDANPETRSVSAVALGYLVDGLGEDKFPGIVAWLMAQMISPDSTVIRSGAAQGLSQVVGQMDIHRFDSLLPKILLGASSQKTSIREGSIGYFIFAPSSMGKRMEPYLRRILPVILHGLADEAETVRDTSVRATQAIVAQYALTSLDILLPCLEDGLFDSNWRIRQSSVQLMGDLLFKIAGEDRLVPDVATMSDDDAIAKASESQIAEALGEAKYQKVLSAIYIIRSDVSPVVRQQSLIVWKSVVQNTPKTLERILSKLMSMIIQCLGSSNDDRRYVASRTMGELVRKLGDRILPSIIPILEDGLLNGDSSTRQGVCLGLTEVLNSAPRKQLEGYLAEVIPTVQKALADPLPEVREAAAKAFDTLIKSAGSSVIDNTVPSILKKLESEETAESAINALKEVLGVRSKAILPQLLPSLLEAPLTAAKSQALVTVAEESGRSLHKHISSILRVLVGKVATDSLALAAASAVVIGVEEEGIHFLLSDILTFAKDKEQPTVRQGAAVLIQELCSKSEEDISQAVPQFLQTLIFGLMDTDDDAMKAHSAALRSCVKAIPKEREGNYLADIRRHLKYCRTQLSAANRPLLLPGFCLPNGAGVAPLLPLFLGGLRSPSSEVRENAALGLGDIISLSSKEALQKQLRLVIGGLIRGVGDRFPGNVKAAILATMGQLLDKSEVATIKSFMVMMQTTFIKNLNDPSQRVREQAGANLGKLISLGTKVDPLVNELLNGVTNAQDEYKETMVLALYNVMGQESSLGERILANAEAKLFALLEHSSASVRAITCKAIGAFCKLAPEEQFSRVLDTSLHLDEDATSALCFSQIMMHASDRLEAGNEEVLASIQKFLAHANHDVQLCGLRSITAIISGNPAAWTAMSNALMPVLTLEKLPNGSSDIRILSLRAIKLFAKRQPSEINAFLDTLVPELMVRVKDRTALPVKLAAERALLHTLQINTNPAVLEGLLQTGSLPAPQQTAVRDYCKRILSKLPADSDDES